MGNYLAIICCLIINHYLLADFSAHQVNQALSLDDQGIMRITCQTKHTLPLAAQSTARNTYCGFLKKNTLVNHPTMLFANDTSLHNLFSTFINNLKAKPHFLPFFSKIHLLMLHQLYLYLTSVYATFSVTHAQNIKDYYQFEQQYALSTKTLIIFHLINLIESQLNQALRAHLPGMPQSMASYSGILALKQDYSCDLSVLIATTEQQIQNDLDDTTSNIISAQRESYLSLYGDYLSFFHRYCACIDQKNKDGLSVFNTHALRIKNLMVSPDSSIKQLSPALFFYEQKTLRALQTLYLLVELLPAYSESIPWPEVVVHHATHHTQARTNFNATLLSNNTIGTEGIPLGYEIAFFDYSIQGQQQLFINIPIANSQAYTTLYSQQLSAQPAWLNTQQGILTMLKACLGDFSLLVNNPLNEEPIIDPFLACITHKALQQGGLAVTPSVACGLCSTFFKALNQAPTDDAMQQSFSPQLPPN